MNELIKQLWEDSDEIKVRYPEQGSPVSVSEQTLEKFAELIVQECMTMCDNVSADYFKHRKAADDFQDKNIYAEGESACDEVRYEIKKHFGVEE